MIVSFFVTTFTFLVGGIEAPFIALCILFIPKVFAYLVVIIAGHMVSIILPSIIIAGDDVAKMPGTLAYCLLAVTTLKIIMLEAVRRDLNVKILLRKISYLVCFKMLTVTTM